MTEIVCPKCGEVVGQVANGSMASFFHCGKSIPVNSFPDLDQIRYGGLPIGKKYTKLRQAIKWLESKEVEHRRLVVYLNDARKALSEVIKIQDASAAHGVNEEGGKLSLNASHKNKVEVAREMLKAHAIANGFDGADLDNVDEMRAYCIEFGLPEMV